MGDIAVRAENLSKLYRIGAKQEGYKTFRDSITDAVTAPFKRVAGLLRGNAAAAANLNETIWALKDVSFEVKKGEVVGIIGRNGAGKSTLLKILSRITEPTSGEAKVYGRVGALLEVGTGFHPELTGRENIYLNGAILGMSREEIKRKFDEIVAFAEVEKFIDTPVKHYSSGMGLRLGFAVAAHLEPEILIVDEVLAVGDAAFQKKCLGKMGEVAGEGRTVLFVSHNMAAVQNLCEQVFLLDKGCLLEAGTTETVVANYLNDSVATSTDRMFERIEEAPGNERIKVRRIRVIPAASYPAGSITMTTPLDLEIEYWNLKPNTLLNLSIVFLTVEGIAVFNTAPVHDNKWLTVPHPQGLFRSMIQIPGYLLNSGTYRVDLYFVEDQSRVLFRMNDALVFDVADAPEVRGNASWFGRWTGIVHPRLEWTTQLLDIQTTRDSILS